MSKFPSSFQTGIISDLGRACDKVTTKCTSCGSVQDRVLIEHRRLCHRQAKYTNSYKCRKCLTSSKSFKSQIDYSYRLDPAWREYCSKASKEYYNNLTDSDRIKLAEDSKARMNKPEMKAKLSQAIKNKFKDPVYYGKIRKARKKYWDDDNYRNNRELNVDEFIYKSRLVHGDKYDYSLVKFDGSVRSIKVDIICPDHGVFSQRPIWHYAYGNGCPRCKTIVSKPHQTIVDYIKSIYNGEVVINDRDIIGFELDIVLPELKYAIEFHSNWYHSHNKIDHLSRYLHYIKANKCYDAGVSLFQIFEYDWAIAAKQSIIKSIIANKLGISNKIYARKCDVISLDNKQYREFIDNNHLYGYRPTTIKYGLTYENELMLAMSFRRHNDDSWEICRLATKTGCYVIGGASKLFNWFISEHNPQVVTSYADRCISSGAVYERLGFDHCGISKPGYKYFKANRVFSRVGFQKHKLEKKLEAYDESLTEHQNMFNNGYRVIWDAGHHIYKWNRI